MVLKGLAEAGVAGAGWQLKFTSVYSTSSKNSQEKVCLFLAQERVRREGLNFGMAGG
jgi:hypothetical protein